MTADDGGSSIDGEEDEQGDAQLESVSISDGSVLIYDVTAESRWLQSDTVVTREAMR